jgi:two-component system, NtrC family, sensor kinase
VAFLPIFWICLFARRFPGCIPWRQTSHREDMRILLADDDAVSRIWLATTLTRAGNEVVTVADGEAAWEQLQKPDAPRLAVLDWMMPKMNGLEVIRRVRTRFRADPIYIIFVTARDSQDDLISGLEAGADDYLTKPVDGRELRARVEVGARLTHLQGLLSQQVLDLQQALEARKHSEDRARLLFATIPHPAWVCDLDTLHFLEVNHAATEHYGYSREEFLGMKITDIRPPEEADQLRQYLEQPKAPHEARGLWQHRTKNGRLIAVDVTSHALEYDGHKASLTIAQDITERKRLEVELRHAQKLEAVGGLAAGIAHELNTPIQFVGDNTRFLQDAFTALISVLEKYQQLRESAARGGAGSAMAQEVANCEKEADLEYLLEEIPKAITQSLDGVTRVATIVRAMKEFAHPGGGEKAATDLNQALESTLVVARSEIKYVAAVETDFGKLPLVACDGSDMNQVFLNLLINAAHAIKDLVKERGTKGVIRVSTREDGQDVLVSIGDTGCGIPDSIRGRIFEPFFTTKEVGRGTGQGLAIARSIVVDKHGGSLTFESEVGKGTTFFIRLPIGGRSGNIPVGSIAADKNHPGWSAK